VREAQAQPFAPLLLRWFCPTTPQNRRPRSLASELAALDQAPKVTYLRMQLR
jgi:hypothetical protein